MTAGEVIAIDGKCLRGSKDSTHSKLAIYMVSTWAQHNELVLAEEPGSGLTSLVKLVSRTGSGDQLTIETRYFTTSRPPNAKLILHAVWGHWHIENSLHWVLDVAFREDDSRIRRDHAPENMALIRHMALNLLKHEASLTIGVNARRKRAGWDNAYLLQVLSVKV